MTQGTTEGTTEALARFALETPSDAIPAEAFAAAERCIVDTVGCMLAGSASEVAEPLLAGLDALDEAGTSPILGTARRTSPAFAALVNGTFGHALDFDDVLSMMPAHPSTVVLPALFAKLPPGVSGQALVEAYAFGIEVGAKIGLGISNAHYRRGFHATGTLAVFSAVAALGRLQRLDVPTLRRAFGIAASMASGIRCNFGTMTKPLHAGWAAHNAVVAVSLARSGFTAHEGALEAASGFVEAYGTEQSDMNRTLAALGQPWALVQPGIALKKYPCIYAVHRPINAVLELKQQLSLTPDNLDTLECQVAPGVFRPLLKHRPTTGLESKFSLDYALAVAMLDGHPGLAAFTDAGVSRPAIAALLPRVHAREDAACLGGDPDAKSRSAGTLGHVVVTARRRDGAEATVRVDKPLGSPERPLGWADLEEKFTDCARYAGLGDKAGELFAAWRGIRGAADVRVAVELATATGRTP